VDGANEHGSGVHRTRGELGDARATLTAAVHALAALPGASLAGVSRLYVTAPVEVTDQPDFHNAVVVLDVPAGPGATPARSRCCWPSSRSSGLSAGRIGSATARASWTWTC
jgi:hypothetical protein